jgi:integrase
VHKLPNLLKSRHGVYYLRTFNKGKERRISLRTKDWGIARLHAHQYSLARAMTFRKLDVVFPNGMEFKNINTDDDLERLNKLIDTPAINEFFRQSAEGLARVRAERAVEVGAPAASPVAQAAVAPAQTARTKPFSEVVKLYLAQKKLENVAKTLEEKETTYTEFQTLFGDADLNSLGSEQAVSFKNRMVSDGQSVQRINKKLSFMKDFFAYATSHKYYFGANPFEGLAISKRAHKAAPESYEEFTDDELKLIFENPLYKTFMNKPDYHWLPFLALYNGARIESLACLQVSQVCKDGETWYLDIRVDKNATSKRKVPLHSRVIAAGFLDYVDSVKKAGKTQLFPHLKPGKNGYSKNCSRRFGQYLDKLKIKDERKVFHSLRVTFINRITNEGVHAAIIMGIVGHYDQKAIDFSSAHMETYQKKKPIEVLKDAVDKVDYRLNFAAH